MLLSKDFRGSDVMEGKRNARMLAVSRRYEPNRLEDAVWAIAYEQVWPILRRRIDRLRLADEQQTAVARSAATLARSA